jgi:Domain of unknown function (DUF1918)
MMHKPSAAVRPQAGDWVVIESRSTNDHGKRGLILEILGESGHEHFRVRWDEEHESLYYPSGGFHIEPPGDPCGPDDSEC